MILDPNKLVLSAIVGRFKDPATGISATATANFRAYGVDYQVNEFDWTPTSPNVAFLNTSDPRTAENSQITEYPALFFYTGAMRNLSIVKGMRFSGTVDAVVDCHMLFRHRRDNYSGMEQGDTETVGNAFRSAMYAMVAFDPTGERAPWPGGLIPYFDSISIEPGPTLLLADGWQQQFVLRMQVEVNIP